MPAWLAAVDALQMETQHCPADVQFAGSQNLICIPKQSSTSKDRESTSKLTSSGVLDSNKSHCARRNAQIAKRKFIF